MIACAIGGGSPFEVACRRVPTPQGFPRCPWPEVPLDHEARGAVGNPCSFRCPHVAGFVLPVVRQEYQKRAGVLFGERYRREILVAASQKAFKPRIRIGFARRPADHRAAAMDAQGLKIGAPRLLIASRVDFLPVECVVGMRWKSGDEHCLHDRTQGKSSKVAQILGKNAISDPAPPATFAIPATDPRSRRATVAGIATIATPSDVETQWSKFTPAQSAVPD